MKSSRKGFTIIEVVLVLAIAGLIFLMVFIALPALQRNQRDMQRKQNLSMLYDALIKYSANHGGDISKLCSRVDYCDANNNGQGGSGDIRYVLSEYLGGSNFVDPGGKGYSIRAYKGEFPNCNRINGICKVVETNSNYFMWVWIGGKCSNDDTKPAVEIDAANQFAVSIPLEGGGVYCLNN